MLLKANFFPYPLLCPLFPLLCTEWEVWWSATCLLRGQLLVTTVLHQLHDPRYRHILPVLALTGCDTPSGHGNSWLIIGQCFISGHVRDPPPQQTSLELPPHHIPQLARRHQNPSITDNSSSRIVVANSCFQLTAYWIAFGPHGPRAQDPPGTNGRIFWGVVAGVTASVAIFGAIRLAAKPAPYTMTKEWQEASNEILKVSPGPSAPAAHESTC